MFPVNEIGTFHHSLNRSRGPEVFCKIAFLEILQNSQENTFARVSFLRKETTPEACNFIKKETLALVFSSKFCEISN